MPHSQIPTSEEIQRLQQPLMRELTARWRLWKDVYLRAKKVEIEERLGEELARSNAAAAPVPRHDGGLADARCTPVVQAPGYDAALDGAGPAGGDRAADGDH